MPSQTHTAVQFFALATASAKKRPTKLVIDVANYIQHHLSEPITAEEIARELYLSRLYLSRKFIAETGESLTDFILKEKTEEAKRLLRYSDRTLTAIGSYLGFSSHGHFSRVFKKYTGHAPSRVSGKIREILDRTGCRSNRSCHERRIDSILDKLKQRISMAISPAKVLDFSP